MGQIRYQLSSISNPKLIDQFSGMKQKIQLTPGGMSAKNVSIKSSFLKKEFNSIPNRKPLYLEMAQKTDDQERDALEEKKKRLEEIRALHKPLEKKDIMEHAINYERIRKEKEMMIREKRKALQQAERERREKLPTFVRGSQSGGQDDVMDMLREPGQLLGVEREKAKATQEKKMAQAKI